MPRRAIALFLGLAAAAAPASAGFTNGDFETGDFTGWTKSSFINPGLSGNEPYSSNSILRNAGGATSESVIVSSPTETGVDAVLTASASLRFPKYATHASRINSSTTGQHANSILQQATITAGDIDAEDGKVHLRFAFAPVLQNPGHTHQQQPFVYVGVRNTSRSNALLYEFVTFAGQQDIPWKTVGTTQYTDWQIADVSPGNSTLAVGDTVQIEIIAAGCSLGGHYGYVYFDGFGTNFIPGLALTATADKTIVTSGDLLTYSFTYRNGGSSAVNNVIVKETVPSSTTFTSVSDLTHCSQASGVVTCNFGTMPANSSGTFQMGATVVTLSAGSTGYIDNGNYTIQGDSVNATLGPLVAVPILGPTTDISISQTVSSATIGLGSYLTYKIYVTNLGASLAQNVVVVDTLAASLTLLSAVPSQGVCTGATVISCSLGTINYPGVSTITIVAQAIQVGSISNTAGGSGSFTDSGGANNSSTTVSSCIALPAAPSAPTPTTLGVSSISWTWNTVSSATSYNFYPSTGGSPIAVAGTSLTQLGLSTNTAYGARVSALIGGVEGPLSSYATGYTFAAPPRNTFAVALSSADIRVQWSTAAASAYAVERSTTLGSGFSLVASSSAVGSASSFVDSGLSGSTTYYYRVRSYNLVGVPSAYDSTTSTSTFLAPPATAPIGLVATALGISSITWTWSAVAGAASYNFYPSTGGAPLSFATTSWIQIGLSTNSAYGARVSAVNSTGQGPLSGYATGYTLALPPSGTVAVALSSVSINVQWTTTGASAYAVERSTYAGAGYVLVGSSFVVGAAASFVDSPLNPSTTYYYRVQSYNGSGIPSAYDLQASTQTLPAAPQVAPSGLAGVGLGISSISWTWNAVSSATSYYFYPSTGGAPIVFVGTSWIQTGLSTSSAYGARVSAVNTTGQGPLSGYATGYTLAAPPVGTVAVVLSSSAVRVQWTATGASAYAVEHSTNLGFGFTLAGSSTAVGAAATFVDSGLNPLTTYYYRVRSYNLIGIPSAYDATASTYTYPAPPGPFILAAYTVSSTTVRWYWTPTGGQAALFTVLTSTGGFVGSVPGTQNFFLETQLSTVTLYTRYVQASNVSGLVNSSTKAVATPYLQSFVTGSSAGVLTGTNGQTELDFAAGLMGNTTTWVLSESPILRPLMSNTVDLIAAAGTPAGVHGSSVSLNEFLVAVNGDRYQGVLSPAVTVKVPYEDLIVPGFVDGTSPPVIVSTLQLYWLNEGTGLWNLVPGSTVDTVHKVVVGQVNHLSIFSAFGVSAQAASVTADLSGMRVYPIPYKPNGGNPNEGVAYAPGDANSGIIFDNVPQSITVRIYNVTGQLVTKFGSDATSGRLQWSVKNDAGKDVASGLYAAVVSSPGVKSVTKKLLIIR